MRTQQVSLVAVLCLTLSFSAFGREASREQLPATTFDQIAKLIAADGQASDEFGSSVAIDGSTIVVGLSSSSRNAAYVFENNSGTVTEVAELTPSDGATGNYFGNSVAISGSTIVVGAPNKSNHDPANQGSVYVFIEPAGGWTSITETAELNVAEAGAHIAYGVATNGSVVVAYPGFVWVEPSGGWANSSVPNAELINSDSQPVGNSVAIDGNVIVLGAPYAYNSYGAAYLYVKPASGWHKIGITETARLVGDATAGGGGLAVAMSGNTVASVANGQGTYVFVKPAGGWASMNQTAWLTPYSGTFNTASVGISGNTVVIGMPTQIVGVNPQQGAAYVFQKPANGWKNTSTANQELVASDGNINDQLGTSVAVSGSTIVAGAPLAEIGSNVEQGATYVFVPE
jgi:hypothetical protein